jgi:hypothetical protein
VEQKVAVEPESSTAQTDDWDNEEDWGEDLPSTENSSPIGEISDEVTNDDQENDDETKVIAAVETVQTEQQITLIEVPVSENTTAEEASAVPLIEEDQIVQEEIVVDEVIAPISETTAAVIEVTVEELADPETNIEQDTDSSNVNETELEEIREAIAIEVEDLPEPTTDFDETTVNTDSAEEEETQNKGEEKQNWADG